VLEGGADPRARRSPLEGSVLPQTGRSLPEGGVCPRARRSLPEGIFKWATWWAVRAIVAWAMPCVLKRGVFGFGSFGGFKWGFPSCLRGPLASAGSPSRLPQMLEPTDRTSFPPGLANAFRGAASVDPRV
jgi:hypothetical protein